jgi:hypothetical protein
MLGHMTRIRSAALMVGAFVPLVLALVILASTVGVGQKLPERFDPPSSGARAEIGVAYSVEAWCLLPIQVGGLWWAFPAGAIEPPAEIPPFPFSIWATLSDPYSMRGVLILSSPNQAVFLADSDGSQFTMTAHRKDPTGGLGCL